MCFSQKCCVFLELCQICHLAVGHTNTDTEGNAAKGQYTVHSPTAQGLEYYTLKSSKNTLYIKERSSLKRTSLQLTQPQIHYAHIFTLIWNTSFAINHNHIYSVNHSEEWLIGTNWSFYISKLYKTLKNSYGLGIAFLIFLIILYSHFV